jgi:hypothetical protein
MISQPTRTLQRHSKFYRQPPCSYYDRIIDFGVHGDGTRPWRAVRLLYEPFLLGDDTTSPCISAIKDRHPRLNVTALNDIGMRLDELEPLGTYEPQHHRKERAALLRDVGTLFAASNVAASRSSFPLMLLKMNPTLRQLHIPTSKDATRKYKLFMLQGWGTSQCAIANGRVSVFEHVIQMSNVTSSADHAKWQLADSGADITTNKISTCDADGKTRTI